MGGLADNAIDDEALVPLIVAQRALGLRSEDAVDGQYDPAFGERGLDEVTTSLPRAPRRSRAVF
jgi:hypothetical protein